MSNYMRLHSLAVQKASWVQEEAHVLYAYAFLFFRALSFFTKCYGLGSCVVTGVAVHRQDRPGVRLVRDVKCTTGSRQMVEANTC